VLDFFGGGWQRLELMKLSAPTVFALLFSWLMALPPLQAEVRSPLGLSGRRAERIEDRRFDRKLWRDRESNSLMDKRFPLTEWDKHFSPVGTKRAPITVEGQGERTIFETKRIDRKELSFDMSRWNERMADLHEKAGIEMSDEVELVANQQMYSAMLQDTQRFSEMGEKLSLRDINRYQFRRNRSDGELPVQRAGAGE
jgi:hypothetical protein